MRAVSEVTIAMLSEDYFYLAAGCDYTGWDCQASGYVEVSMDLERLIRLGIPAADYEGMAKAGAP